MKSFMSLFNPRQSQDPIAKAIQETYDSAVTLPNIDMGVFYQSTLNGKQRQQRKVRNRMQKLSRKANRR